MNLSFDANEVDNFIFKPAKAKLTPAIHRVDHPGADTVYFRRSSIILSFGSVQSNAEHERRGTTIHCRVRVQPPWRGCASRYCALFRQGSSAKSYKEARSGDIHLAREHLPQYGYNLTDLLYYLTRNGSL